MAAVDALEEPTDAPVAAPRLYTYFQFTATPSQEGGRAFYYLVTNGMNWHAFLDLLPRTPEIIRWRECRLCWKIWMDLSRLAGADGKPVFLGGNPEEYGILAVAVRAYQAQFRTLQVEANVLFAPPNPGRDKAGCIGRPTNGSCDGKPFNHLCADLQLGVDYGGDGVNKLLRQEVPLVEQFLEDWASGTVSTILERYKTKGETAPGYKVNIGGLEFMVALQAELDRSKDKRPQTRRMIVVTHMLRLFAGPRPADALGAIHIFASGSNIAACRIAMSEDAFWAIMKARYDPVRYLQPTSLPTDNQVAAAMQMVGGDTALFERIHLHNGDPMVVTHTIWASPQEKDQTRITADALRALARKKPVTGGKGKTCFDGGLPATRRHLSLGQDGFLAWLAEIAKEPSSKVEYMVPDGVHPIEVGVATSQKAADMLRVPASWVTTPTPVSASAIDIKSGYQDVKLMTYHPGRWRDPTREGGKVRSTPEDAVVSDGFVLQLVAPGDWKPNCSCLFAQFFSGSMHGMSKVRQLLHETLRIRQPADMPSAEIFRGIMLTSKRQENGQFEFAKPEFFRAVLPDGSHQTVTVH